MATFNYHIAFSKNYGWLTTEEQEILRTKRVAIPGMGGVGGHHVHNLCRLGITKFHLADMDTFELHNFNRQLGANMNTLNKSKVDVLSDFAKSINPEVDVKVFRDGVTKENAADFLEGVDLVIDSLDLFAIEMRQYLFDMAYKKGIPVITAGPFGVGTSVMAFDPKGMSFSEYFDLDRPNITPQAKVIRFMVGMSPTMMHRKYLRMMDPKDVFKNRLPSLNAGCDAAASACGALTIQILLNRPGVRWAPKGFHADFYLQQAKRFSRPRGNKGLRQMVKIKVYHKFFKQPEFITKNTLPEPTP